MAISVSIADRFQSGNARANVLRAFLAFIILLNVISIFSSLSQKYLIEAVQRGETVTREQAEDNDARQGQIILLQIAGQLGFIIALAAWFHRVYRNLRPLGGSGMKYSPAWSAAYFFIPIYCVVRPYQVACEIWKVSESPDPVDLRMDSPSPSTVKWWWAVFLIDCLACNFIFRFSAVKSIPTLLLVTKLTIVANLILVISCIVSWRMVTAIDQMQAEKDRSIRMSRRAGATASVPHL